MKISVTQPNLMTALSHVIKATASKSNIPVLSNVLIKTEKGKVKLATTDLEIAISTWIGADIAEEGEVTVNAKLLAEFVSELKTNRLELIQSGQVLEVKSVDNNAQFYTIPTDDFPVIPEAESQADLVVNAKKFEDTIEKTSFATAADDSKPILTGLLLESTKKRVSLVGVDGFRLSKRTIDVVKPATDDLNLVIPAKSLLELAKIISGIVDDDDNVNIFLLKDKNQVLFKVNEVELSSRLLEGDFPEYQQIIPSEKVLELKIDKKELEDSVKIINIFARNIIGNKVFYKVKADEKLIDLSTRVADVGNSQSSAEVKEIDGDDYETAYNARYLLEMINSMDGDDITFETNGVASPGVFKDSQDEDYLHIVMPMRMH
jgi:DNA polymerase-3 subunit beta